MKSKMRGYSNKEKGVGAVFEEVYILAGKRTPFGKYTGALATVSPTDLGIIASKAAIKASNVNPEDIDQTIVSNIGQASADAFFLPRHIGLYSGAPLHTPASLVQRICGSGIEVLNQAAEQICLGKAELVLCCGTDTMSLFPLVSFDARLGFPLGKPAFKDMLWEALDDTAAVPMGVTADNLAKEYHLTRPEVDAVGKRSQDLYAAAKERNFFKDELVTVENCTIEGKGLKPRKVKLHDTKMVDCDENPRQTDLEKLAKLPHVFTPEGPTTPGTASGIVDGACALLVASKSYVDKHNLKPIGRIIACATVGVEPRIMGIGPVPAIQSVLAATDKKIDDIDLFEINEAFAAQCLSVAKALKLDMNKLNVNGGAVAIGHPLGATGLRLVLTCLRALKEKNKKLGMASACIGGGQGIAMMIESL